MSNTVERPAPPTVLGPQKFAFDPAAFRWDGVTPQAYKFSLGDARGMGWRGVARFTLAGPPAWPVTYELRYFELDPGGYSSFEKHVHAHFIIAIRGTGRAVVGEEVYLLAPFDVLFVPPGTPHRWINEGQDPFGFLCPVDSRRDPPQPLTDAEWDALGRVATVAPYLY